jgi:hypothetical protein
VLTHELLGKSAVWRSLPDCTAPPPYSCHQSAKTAPRATACTAWDASLLPLQILAFETAVFAQVQVLRHTSRIRPLLKGIAAITPEFGMHCATTPENQCHQAHAELPSRCGWRAPIKAKQAELLVSLLKGTLHHGYGCDGLSCGRLPRILYMPP